MNALPIDLRPEELAVVRGILHAHIPEREVLAFGSRVNGKAKKFSDLDLVVMGDEALPTPVFSQLGEAFEASDLPFRVDVIVWEETSAEFRRVIQGQETIKMQ